MAILGNQVRSVPFTVDVFSGDGSDTSFVLSRSPASTASIAVFINGLYQRPSANYTLDGVNINFAAAPVLGENNVQVLHVGEGQATTQTPADGSVDSVKMASTVAVTNFRANTTLRAPVYADNTARDAAITSPLTGMLLISGTQFQGYNGSGWVVLNN
jgi:hypothetical protein